MFKTDWNEQAFHGAYRRIAEVEAKFQQTKACANYVLMRAKDLDPEVGVKVADIISDMVRSFEA